MQTIYPYPCTTIPPNLESREAMEHEAKGMTEMPSGTHFVLIHGACHGAWCWYKLRCLLESAGCHVTCLDLASSGIDPSDADSISTFDDYNKPLLDFMASLPLHHKVIVVGHSAGGQSVTQILHKFPHKIRAAVYVAATMLPFGFQTPIDIQHGAPDFSEYGDVYIYGYGLGVDQPPTSVLFKNEYLRELFYNMSPLEDLNLSRMLLRPCPIRAMKDAKFASEGGEDDDAWERVPRVYITTLHDHTLKSELQEGMIKRWPPSLVYEVDSDHSPFFSNPSALFGLLLKVAHAFT